MSEKTRLRKTTQNFSSLILQESMAATGRNAQFLPLVERTISRIAARLTAALRSLRSRVRFRPRVPSRLFKHIPKRLQPSAQCSETLEEWAFPRFSSPLVLVRSQPPDLLVFVLVSGEPYGRRKNAKSAYTKRLHPRQPIRVPTGLNRHAMNRTCLSQSPGGARSRCRASQAPAAHSAGRDATSPL